MEEPDYSDGVIEVELEQLAGKWLSDIRRNLPDEDSEDSDAGQAVVSMNFSAPPEIQWRFILIAVSLSESDDELGHVAAGPIEHLLGWHGDAYISIVENEARTNPKFARALTGVWQYMMADEVWSRLRMLQQQVAEPLRSSAGDDTEDDGPEQR
jgi:Family of unknown function (DUF6869)